MRRHSGARAPEEVVHLPRRLRPRHHPGRRARSTISYFLHPLVWILDWPVFSSRFSLRVRHVLLIVSLFWGAHHIPGVPSVTAPIAWSDIHINFVDPEQGCPRVPICDSNHSSFLDVGVRIPVPTGIGRWVGNLRAALRSLEGLGGWRGGYDRPGRTGK